MNRENAGEELHSFLSLPRIPELRQVPLDLRRNVRPLGSEPRTFWEHDTEVGPLTYHLGSSYIPVEISKQF